MKKLLLFLFSFVLLGLASGQDNSRIPEAFRKDFLSRGEAYFSFKILSRTEISKLTQVISIDNIKGDSVYAYASQKEFLKFLDYGYVYRHLLHPGDDILAGMFGQEALSQPMLWDSYPTYPAYETMMAQFQSSYPEICHVDTLVTLASGRRLIIAKISSNVNTPSNKPQFLYTSSMHGDETTGYILMLRLIDYLLSNYGTDTRVTNLLNNIEIYINPLANPDGTYHGGNTTVNGAIRYNAYNIDLNRNFPDPQAGPHPDGNNWQPETVTWMNFANTHHITLAANFHGGSEVVNYPWDTWPQLNADDAWWQLVAREYADTCHANAIPGYLTDLDNGITNGYAWYQVTGGRQDFMNYFHHARECTIELSTTKKPPGSDLPSYWNYNWHSFLNYLQECLYSVRGIVTDTFSGQALHAFINIAGHDADSTQVYSNLPIGDYHRYLYAGTYNLTFSAPGYFTKTINNVTVTNFTTLVQDVQLNPLLGNTSLTGKLTYDNVSGTAMSNVTIYLKTSIGDTIATTMTNSTGDYSFTGISPGLYTFDFSTTKAPGGFNAVDALAALKYFVQIQQLTGLELVAADVNNNNVVNSIDALMIQQRFVGMITSFAAGSWAFTNDTINVVSGPNVHDLKAICYGDVNGSYIPPN